MDLQTLVAIKKFVDNSIAGISGVVAGKNCTIQSIDEITGGHRITFKWTPDSGSATTSTVDVMNGAAGNDGADGVSPSVSVSTTTGGHKITITDAEGDHDFDVLDGEKGETGLGIKSVSVTEENHLVVTYDDNTEKDAGEIDVSSKQDKELETPITVDGEEQTTVEGALGAINSSIEEKIPALPETDGTYVLQASVESGVITYSWEAV